MWHSQHSTSMKPQKCAIPRLQRGMTLHVWLFNLGAIGYDMRWWQFWHCCCISHRARCHSSPVAHLLPSQHVHPQRYTNDYCLLLFVTYIVAVLEGVIWESNFFFSSKALFKSHSKLIDVLIFQCRHCVYPPKPGCPCRAEDLVYESKERVICKWHENTWKQFGDRTSL